MGHPLSKFQDNHIACLIFIYSLIQEEQIGQMNLDASANKELYKPSERRAGQGGTIVSTTLLIEPDESEQASDEKMPELPQVKMDLNFISEKLKIKNKDPEEQVSEQKKIVSPNKTEKPSSPINEPLCDTETKIKDGKTKNDQDATESQKQLETEDDELDFLLSLDNPKTESKVAKSTENKGLFLSSWKECIQISMTFLIHCMSQN